MYETEPCETCGQPVIRATGYPKLTVILVDPGPRAEGNLQLLSRPGQPPLALAIVMAKRFGRTGLRLAHPANCKRRRVVASV